ncbi:MAG: HPr family phosphocarrier protein [Endomicrobiaceae bacterium]|jgi:phosphocarrier protein|nr:HPr family phosphocarrier protein [Endomicrobiaceae bacterium]MDD3730075.1 HPr family phosphocarrier protein [Endomicrobiaceae bacterium]MDD4166409.1 HPr family phosphocarrier protein [Endomicrobiaceae bacterium]
MTEKKLRVINKLGLHARPASMVVQSAMKFQSTITIVKDEYTVDAKSIMGLMMLAAANGTELLFRADGIDENEAISKMEEIFNNGFGEEI